MSTSNFKSQKDFKLMAWGLNGEDEFHDMEQEFDDLLYAEEKKRPLQFFELKLESGYYEGVQVVVNYKHDDCYCIDYGNPKYEDNEGCKELYGMCRSKAIKAHDSEVKYINNKLLPKLKEIGFIELAVSARFSNGETWYSKVA